MNKEKRKIIKRRNRQIEAIDIIFSYSHTFY